MIPFGVTVTVLRMPAQTLPTFGNYTGSPVATIVKDCAIWPVSTEELVQGQDTVTWDLNCFMPTGTDVLSSDQVEVDGTVYDIVGQPQDWKSQLIRKSAGVLVQLKAGTG